MGRAVEDWRDERLIVGLLVALVVTAGALAYALVLPLASAAGAGVGRFWHLAHGPALALYAPVLALCVRPRRGWLWAGVLGVLGATHQLWIVGVLLGLHAAGVRRSLLPSWLDASMLVLATGLVLTPAVWAAAGRWWSGFAMALATGLASLVSGGVVPALGGARGDAQATAIAVLHVGVAWSLFAAVVARTWRIVPEATSCPACGYPTSGLRGAVCPECGGPIG